VSLYSEYDGHDALGLAALVRDGEVSASELVETCIARIEAVNPKINAVVHTLYQQARAMAESPGGGPFAGVPFLLKDLSQMIEGVPTVGGCRFRRGWVAPHDSTLYRRYREAGLITVAKTNTPELGLLPVTEPEIFGPTRTPWDLSRTSGGSSGGSAAAVAAGVVPMAQGGDGGGSIRIPASCCGLFGLKPSRGRMPTGPDASEYWNGFAQEHVISRTVRDSAAALDATAGAEAIQTTRAPAPERPFLDEVGAEVGTLRIGFTNEPVMPASVHEDCKGATLEVAQLLTELGHEVEEVRPRFATRELARAFFTVVAANTAAELQYMERLIGRPVRPQDVERETWLTAQMGYVMTGADVALAHGRLQEESRRVVRDFDGYDAILTPTLGAPPVEIGALRIGGLEGRVQELVRRSKLRAPLRLPGMLERTIETVFAFIPFTPLANFTGRPSMSVPLVWSSDGLPIGSMFTGRYGEEALLLRLAAQLEEARPWKDRRPPVHA